MKFKWSWVVQSRKTFERRQEAILYGVCSQQQRRNSTRIAIHCFFKHFVSSRFCQKDTIFGWLVGGPQDQSRRVKAPSISPHLWGEYTEGGKPSKPRMASDKKGKTSRELSEWFDGKWDPREMSKESGSFRRERKDAPLSTGVARQSREAPPPEQARPRHNRKPSKSGLGIKVRFGARTPQGQTTILCDTLVAILAC